LLSGAQRFHVAKSMAIISSEIPHEIHPAMENPDDFHIALDEAIEKDVRFARKAMIAGADFRAGASEIRLTGDQRHVLPEPPHIGFGLVDAPSVSAVVRIRPARAVVENQAAAIA
jgi:hypothetical protein